MCICRLFVPIFTDFRGGVWMNYKKTSVGCNDMEFVLVCVAEVVYHTHTLTLTHNCGLLLRLHPVTFEGRTRRVGGCGKTSAMSVSRRGLYLSLVPQVLNNMIKVMANIYVINYFI